MCALHVIKQSGLEGNVLTAIPLISGSVYFMFTGIRVRERRGRNVLSTGFLSELIHLHAAFVVIFLKPPPVEFDAQWDTPSHTLPTAPLMTPYSQPTIIMFSLANPIYSFKKRIALYFPFTP